MGWDSSITGAGTKGDGRETSAAGVGAVLVEELEAPGVGLPSLWPLPPNGL